MRVKIIKTSPKDEANTVAIVRRYNYEVYRSTGKILSHKKESSNTK